MFTQNFIKTTTSILSKDHLERTLISPKISKTISTHHKPLNFPKVIQKIFYTHLSVSHALDISCETSTHRDGRKEVSAVALNEQLVNIHTAGLSPVGLGFADHGPRPAADVRPTIIRHT